MRINNEREKKLVISSLVQLLYYKKVISFQESLNLLKKIRAKKAERMLEILYNNKVFKENISIEEKNIRFWLSNTAWKLKMRREMTAVLEKACHIAAFFASKLKEDQSVDIIYANSYSSEALSLMLSIYSDVNYFSIGPEYDISSPENLLVPVVLGFETNLEIERKEEIPYFGVNLLYKVSETKRKMGFVYKTYCKIMQKKIQEKRFCNNYEKRLLKRTIEKPNILPIKRWQKICIKSIHSLNKELENSFNEVKGKELEAEEEVPTPLASSITWLLNRKSLEETIDVITKIPIVQEDFDINRQPMYG
ncbi:MAG: hypothetical protein QXD95_06460 [Nitrososphaeria archaeon]